ncbi:hypothetical protein [Granulicella paludicola]|jgi:hypothetical protein|uniref:hypothetical protein n=1 Tax=Granulicella paludicola TaxID=474951 RepID=UPI0021E07F67|nr:hypothetical protein [Granulicella paludicola]
MPIWIAAFAMLLSGATEWGIAMMSSEAESDNSERMPTYLRAMGRSKSGNS